MKSLIVSLWLTLSTIPIAWGQSSLRVLIQDAQTHKPLIGATALLNPGRIGAAADTSGRLVLRAVTADGAHEFAGTVLRDEPHIVEVDGYWVDFVPDGALMFTYHRDRPGMIGRVGMLLGAADVNISGMYVGRLAPREQAMMVLTLDDEVPETVLDQIHAEEDIQRAVAVVL